MWAFIVPIYSRTSSSTAKNAGAFRSFPAQTIPWFQWCKCQSLLSSELIRATLSGSAGTRPWEQTTKHKSATHHLQNTAPAAQGNAAKSRPSAAPRHPNPRHLHSQGQSTAGRNSRKRKQMLQESANTQSDSDLKFTPAFASLHRAWFQALFAIVQKMPLQEATNVKEDQRQSNSSTLCRNLRNKEGGRRNYPVSCLETKVSNPVRQREKEKRE